MKKSPFFQDLSLLTQARLLNLTIGCLVVSHSSMSAGAPVDVIISSSTQVMCHVLLSTYFASRCAQQSPLPSVEPRSCLHSRSMIYNSKQLISLDETRPRCNVPDVHQSHSEWSLFLNCGWNTASVAVIKRIRKRSINATTMINNSLRESAAWRHILCPKKHVHLFIFQVTLSKINRF